MQSSYARDPANLEYVKAYFHLYTIYLTKREIEGIVNNHVTNDVFFM